MYTVKCGLTKLTTKRVKEAFLRGVSKKRF